MSTHNAARHDRPRFLLNAMLIILVLLAGCKNSPKFDQMVDRQLIYAGTGQSMPGLSCSFNLQTVYFSGYAIDSFLYLTLENGTGAPITLNASEDQIAVVIFEGRKYTVQPASSPDYGESIEAGGTFKTRFRLHTESLVFHAERREISVIEYQLADAGDTCFARPR